MTVISETTLFTIFLLVGALVGLLFDFFRILRKSFRTPDIITYIEDIIFGIITGTILIFSIIIFNNGELRLFIFVGIILGNIIYCLTISKYVVYLSVKILVTILKIIKGPIKLISIPIILIVKKIKQYSIKIQKKLKKDKK